MRAILLTAAAMLTLAGCGKADDGPKTMEQAKEEAAELERPEPGQYRQSTKVTKFEVPGAPPEMVAQIKAMMEGQNNNVTYCLTKEESDKGFEEMFKKGREGSCKYDRFDASSDTLDAVMVCDTGDGGEARLTLKGSISSTGSKVNVDIEQKGSKTPMSNAVIAMQMETTRIGDCPAGGQ